MRKDLDVKLRTINHHASTNWFPQLRINLKRQETLIVAVWPIALIWPISSVLGSRDPCVAGAVPAVVLRAHIGARI